MKLFKSKFGSPSPSTNMVQTELVPTAGSVMQKRANFTKKFSFAKGGMIPPKKDQFGRASTSTLNWKDSAEKPYYKDEAFMQDLKKRQAGSAYVVNRNDWDNPGANPGFDQLSGSYKKQLYSEFQKDPNLNEVYAGDINWAMMPSRIEGGKDYGQAGNGSEFMVYSRGYNPNPVEPAQLLSGATEAPQEMPQLTDAPLQRNPPAVTYEKPYYMTYNKPGSERYKADSQLVSRVNKKADGGRLPYKERVAVQDKYDAWLPFDGAATNEQMARAAFNRQDKYNAWMPFDGNNQEVATPVPSKVAPRDLMLGQFDERYGMGYNAQPKTPPLNVPFKRMGGRMKSLKYC